MPVKQSFVTSRFGQYMRMHFDDPRCIEDHGPSRGTVGLHGVISKLSTSLARALMRSSIPTPPLSCFRIILARIAVYPRLM